MRGYMQDIDKTKEQLIDELNSLRKTVAALKNNHQAANHQIPTDKRINVNTEKRSWENDSQNLLFEITGFGVIYFNLAGDILYINKPARIYMKREIDDIIGKNVFDVFDNEEAALVLNRIKHIAEHKQSVEYKDFIKLPIGKIYFLTRYIFLEGENAHSPTIAIISHNITKWEKMTKRLEQAQREKSILLDSMNEMFAYYNLDMEIQWVNKAAADSVNMSPGEMIGKHCYEIWNDKNTPCENCPVIKAMKSGRPHEAEKMTPDGRKWILRGYPVFDDAGKIIGLIEFGQNVTQRKKAEKALAWEQYLMRTFMEHIPDAIYFKNKNGQFIRINKAQAKRFGLNSPEEALGKTDFDFFKKEDAEDMFIEDQQVIKNGKSVSTERKKRFLNGREGWAFSFKIPLKDEQGKITGLFGITRDITQRKTAEKALKISEERLRKAQELAHVGSWDWDIKNMTLVWSDELYRIFGVAPNSIELTYDSIASFIHDEDKEHNRQMLDKIKSTEKYLEYTMRIVRPDGEIRHIKQRIEIVRDGAGNATNAFGTIADITKLKVAQQEKTNLEEQLYQSQKLEAIGRLAGGVAHDFNNMLTAIIGNADLLLSDSSDRDLMLEDIDEIKKAAERASNLTKQLLAFSRKQPLKMDIVDLTLVVADIDKMLQRLIGEDIQLTTQLAEDLKRVKADRGQIEQVIINLAVNAKDAMPDGGTISICAENVVVDKSIRDKCNHVDTNEFVRITISDTGAGMTEEVKSRIFEPFFSTKERGKGTGLGLAVVYGIIRQHNGWIEVESGLNEGTIFKIYLPVFNFSSTKRKKSAGKIHEFDGMGKRILLVEDEETVRKFAFRALADNGYQVFEAKNHTQAIEVFTTHQGNFDLIFSDVVLPDHSGITLVEKLSEDGSHFRILLSSGYTDDKSQWSLIQKRGYNFIPKPYTIHELLETIKCILNE